MKHLKSILLLCAASVLFGCGSAPKIWNSSGERYISENSISYSGVKLSVRSDNEEKSVRVGYMSDAAVREYMEVRLLSQLEALNLLDADGPVIDLDMDISRVFSWGGNSMASVDYKARVSLWNGSEVLGRYAASGRISDNSIAGDFKAIFASNSPADEGKYFDYIADQVLSRLPK